MPVRKFRTVEDMEQPEWRTPGDPELYRAIRRVWEFGRRSGPRRFASGVYRYGSLAELNAQTERWRIEAFRTRERR
jgi:hypothetical protein